MKDTLEYVVEHKGRAELLKFAATKTAPVVAKEVLADNYGVLAAAAGGVLKFSPGEVIVDLGANEGMFSIMMARVFPGVRVIAVEPIPETNETLWTNVALNGVEHEVTIVSAGVGAGPGMADFTVSKDFSGGSSSFTAFKESDHVIAKAPILGLDEIFDLYNITSCKLLKVDIEGGEYDALYNFTYWDRVENLVAEFHTNSRLDYLGRRIDGLVNWLGSRTRILHAEACKMAD